MQLREGTIHRGDSENMSAKLDSML